MRFRTPYLIILSLLVTICGIEADAQRPTLQVSRHGSELCILAPLDGEKDIVIRFAEDYRNGNVTPLGVYTHPRLEQWDGTTELLPMIHYTFDSTPPIALQNYGYIYGEHGYQLIQARYNALTLGAGDINSRWKDSTGRIYSIAWIEGNKVALAPRIVTDGAGPGMHTQDYVAGDPLPSGELVNVDDARRLHISDVTTFQCLGFTHPVERIFLADDTPIQKGHTYHCKTVTIIDRHRGIDPRRVTSWRPTPNGEDLVEFEFIYRIEATTMSVESRLTALDHVWLDYYGAFQPLGLTKYLDYHPYICYPKVLPRSAQGKVTVDWNFPQDCVTPREWAVTTFYNNTYAPQIMEDDNLPDRTIQWLAKPGETHRTLGFAAGYSLISGLTEPSSRSKLTLKALYYSNDYRNKTYFSAIDCRAGAPNPLPPGWTGEFNYYYSWFKPADNDDAIAYHYSDKDFYVVYLHTFSSGNHRVQLPGYVAQQLHQAEVVETTGNITILNIADDGVVELNSSAAPQWIVLKCPRPDFLIDSLVESLDDTEGGKSIRIYNTRGMEMRPPLHPGVYIINGAETRKILIK